MRRRGHHFPSLCFLDVVVPRALIYYHYIHRALHVLYTVAVNLHIHKRVPASARHVVFIGKAIVFSFSTVVLRCVAVVCFGTPTEQAVNTDANQY